MSFLPFDYLVISNQEFDSDTLQDTFSFFSSCGIRKFIFLLNFDRTIHTVSWIKDRKKLLEQSLRKLHSKGLIVSSFLNLELTDGIVYDPMIDRLILNHSSFLFVQLPLFCDDPWIDANLNHLLYKKKIPLVLTSFEENIHTNSQIRIEQILQSNAYYISLDLNYITALDSELCLKRIISREISVLPCISHHLSNYVGVVAAFDHLKDRLGTPVYQNLCRNFLNAEKTFFSHHYYCTK